MNASVYSTSGRVALDEKELSLLDTSRIASTGSHTDL
ncbi:unknown [Parabacteroides sp. CAG:2]|nr:unknown [Parabacteroides sp. CAG:2]